MHSFSIGVLVNLLKVNLESAGMCQVLLLMHGLLFTLGTQLGKKMPVIAWKMLFLLSACSHGSCCSPWGLVALAISKNLH